MEDLPDWTPSQILTALRKKGLTLSGLAIRSNVPAIALSNAMTTAWFRGEQIIASEIGEPAETIWPSRYFCPNGVRRYYFDKFGRPRLRIPSQ